MLQSFRTGVLLKHKKTCLGIKKLHPVGVAGEPSAGGKLVSVSVQSKRERERKTLYIDINLKNYNSVYVREKERGMQMFEGEREMFYMQEGKRE